MFLYSCHKGHNNYARSDTLNVEKGIDRPDYPSLRSKRFCAFLAKGKPRIGERKFMAPPPAKCRICSCDFKIQFGTTAGKDQHRSSENLFLPSKRRECFGTILAEIVKSVGLHVPNEPSRYSSRVCNKCACKIRNLGHIHVYGEVKSSLKEQNNNLSTPSKENIAPTKRLLNTPQGNSPCHKAVRVNSPASKLSLRKSLSFARREITDEE